MERKNPHQTACRLRLPQQQLFMPRVPTSSGKTLGVDQLIFLALHGLSASPLKSVPIGKVFLFETQAWPSWRETWFSMCAASALFQNLYKSQGTGPLKIEDLTTIYMLNESQATSTFKCLHRLDSCSKAKAARAPRPERRAGQPMPPWANKTQFSAARARPPSSLSWITPRTATAPTTLFPVLASFTALPESGVLY